MSYLLSDDHRLVGADPEQRQAKGSGSKFTVLSVDFQPTIQPTICDVLCDLQVFWQSPRSCKFYKGRSQEKTHLARLEFFLLLSPLDRARFVLTYRTMCSVAGQCAPAVWVFTTSGFHRLFATKPVSCKTSPRYSDKGEVGVQVHPGPPFVSVGYRVLSHKSQPTGLLGPTITCIGGPTT